MHGKACALKRFLANGALPRSAAFIAANGKVHAHVHRRPLADINDVFRALKAGEVDGRVVLEMAAIADQTSTAVGTAKLRHVL
jgi:hypothetical protein